MRSVLRFLITILFFSSTSFAYSKIQVPTKYRDKKLTQAVKPHTKFTMQQIENREYILAKNSEWSACHQKQPQPFSLMQDSVSAFLESANAIRTLQDMEVKGLKAGKVKTQPWSGDYWSYDAGLLAARSFDPGFQQIWGWKDRYDYVRGEPMNKILNDGADLNRLSPAEKYDLIFGDVRAPLTESMWQQGKVYFDEYGLVESWMGICHGWAPASIFEKRPEIEVSVPAGTGDYTVKLLPSELKGLLSYSWATNRYPSITLGQRCNEKDPPHDENGRLTHPECFDLNPGTWHLAVVNRLGAAKKSFVIDATFDYQVWNQPVLEYSYEYFNVKTDAAASHWKDAKVSIQDWKSDPYAKYRDSKVKSLVGVLMKLAYVVETRVSSEVTDDESQDEIHWVLYRYDLELDANDKIIGGEWHQDSHPDFMWTPMANAVPNSTSDRFLKEAWNADNQVPDTWKDVSSYTSPSGVILNKMVQALAKKSQKPL